MHLHVLLVASLALTLPAIRDEHFSYLDAARPPRSVLVTNQTRVQSGPGLLAFSPWPLGGFTCSSSCFLVTELLLMPKGHRLSEREPMSRSQARGVRAYSAPWQRKEHSSHFLLSSEPCLTLGSSSTTAMHGSWTSQMTGPSKPTPAARDLLCALLRSPLSSIAPRSTMRSFGLSSGLLCYLGPKLPPAGTDPFFGSKARPTKNHAGIRLPRPRS